MGRLLHFYPQFSRDYVENELPMDEGWALHCYAVESDGWLSLNGVRRSGRGYVRQETDRLMAMVVKK